MLTLFLLSGLAQAEAWIEHFSYSEFPSSRSVLGIDGWEGGYSGDDWYCDDWFVSSTSDDSGGEWGMGGPADNWLTNTEIAESENVPVATVGTWLRRGRSELQHALRPMLRELDRGAG